MRFELHINVEDYIAFNIYHATHNKQAKKYYVLSRLLMPIFSACAIIIFLVAKASISLLLTEIVVLAAISVYYCVHYPKMFEKRLRRHIEKQDLSQLFHTDETIEFTDTEVISTTTGEITRTAYTNLGELYVTDDYLYLYKNAISAFILPKRCLNGQTEELLQFLHAKNITK